MDQVQGGLLRIKEVLKLIPVSKTTWWNGVKTGRFPQSVKLSSRVTCWRAQDIQQLIDDYNNKANDEVKDV